MLIELVNTPLFLPFEPPAKSNINIDYKLKSVPPERIKNKVLRYKKLRWIKAQQTQREMSIMLMNYKHVQKLPSIDKKNKVYVSAHFYFASNRRKDLDNCTKCFFDALTKSGLIEDDSQIVLSVLQKNVDKNNPGIKIYSVAHTDKDTEESRKFWLANLS